MKVSKWKVLSIAGALVLGYVVSSDAAQIKVSDDTFADLGYWMKVRYVNFDERAKDKSTGIDYNTNVFDVVDARFNIEGQINKIVQFYGEVVTSGAYSSDVYAVLDKLGLKTGRDTVAKLSEGGINLVFLPELQLRLGKIRIPFTRDQQEARYSYIIQSDWIYDPFGIFSYWRNGLLRLFDGGAVLHGEIAGGMFRYDLGIFNEASDKKPLQDVAWAARIEFTPTMLGFTPETKTTGRGWLHDTYLGKKGDKLTIGLSYFNQDVVILPDAPYEAAYYSTDTYDASFFTGNVYKGTLLPGVSNDIISLILNGELRDAISALKDGKKLNVDGWNVDVFLEKKLGPAVINLEGAYTYFDDSHIAYYYDEATDTEKVKKESSYYWYIQGQILYDCVVGIGKPALYAKYEYIEADGVKKDLEMNRWAVGINYYIVGNAARLTVGVDNVNYDGAASKYLKELGYEDNITDYYVQAQIMF
ncbi:hypothetical protein TOPB45_1622 [Thermodesulfobacterium geofontis OPF15]|uniref:Porin n=1 Tax=Thermodesulfobacterium geofontis (strain OPF15) TaxID=795359 RepID=F8C3X3_THEGP|nr:hypothetical protein [Thermodesulfobacterium geofontis]AEH23700.1 hypothetical protein TOPB45_1622 [Thermodesulfobacterium geofontis OPF15]